MHDALDETLVGRIPTGEAFRQRFGNPYAVIHRADVHMSLLEGAQESDRIEVLTSTTVQRVDQDDAGVTVHDAKGNTHRGIALIGADGVKSAVRRQYVGDDARVSGHVVYRAVIDKKDFPVDLQWNAASIWVGPNCHLVHYPLRGGEQYNVVVTFHSREKEEWSVREGSREEVQSWGLQMERRIARKQEQAFFAHTPKNQPAGVALFGQFLHALGDQRDVAIQQGIDLRAIGAGRIAVPEGMPVMRVRVDVQRFEALPGTGALMSEGRRRTWPSPSAKASRCSTSTATSFTKALSTRSRSSPKKGARCAGRGRISRRQTITCRRWAASAAWPASPTPRFAAWSSSSRPTRASTASCIWT